MTDNPATRDHTLDQLPRVLQVEGDVIVCTSCRRRWRVPPDGRLNDDNFTYLYEHVDLHVRSRHKRPRQQWSSDIHWEMPAAEV